MEGCIDMSWAVNIYLGVNEEVSELNQLFDSTRGWAILILTLLAAPTWMAWWNARVARREVTANGGKSMADRMVRIEERQVIMQEKQGVMSDHIKLHTTQIGLLMEDRGMGKTNEILKNEKGIE